MAEDDKMEKNPLDGGKPHPTSVTKTLDNPQSDD
jgi:hypothetical protein